MDTAKAMKSCFSRRALTLLLAGLTFTSISLVPVMARAAAVSGDPPQVVVGYADLNLSNPADISKLYRRIDQAASQVCGNFEARDLQQSATVKVCRQDALTQAVAKVNNPKLSDEYLARTGRVANTEIVSASR